MLETKTQKAIAECLEARKERFRRSKQRKRAVSAVGILLILSFITIISMCMVFLPRPATSEIEKRELAKFPEFSFESYFKGEFTSGITSYFSDTVPFRENLLSAANHITSLMGVKVDNATFHGAVEIVNESSEESSAESSESLPDVSAPVTSSEITVSTTEPPKGDPTESDNLDGAIEFKNNGIVVINTTGLMLFGGNNTQGKRYADAISKYKEQLGENVNVYNLLVPTSAEFYLPEKYKQYSNSEKACIDYVYSALSPSVTTVDAYSKLAEHKDEYLYFRTDHHWTPLGAYYAYAAFCEQLGMEYPTLDKYEHKVKEGYVGSLYGYTSDVVLKDNPDTFNYYIPPDKYTAYYYNYANLSSKGSGSLFFENVSGGNCYSMFIGADAVHTKVVTEHKNGRKIAVFKESYGNAFVPFLVSNFEEIYVFDIRYFGKNAVEYMKQNGITDVLFIDNIFAANTGSLIGGIERLLTSPTGTIIPKPVETTTPPPATSETQPTEATSPAETTVPVVSGSEQPAVTAPPPEQQPPAETSVTP